MTPDETAAEEAARRVAAGLRYITSRYGNLISASGQAGAAMQQVTGAWYAAGGSGARHPGTPSLAGHVDAARGSGGNGSGGGSSMAPGGGGGGSSAAGNGSYGIAQVPGGNGGSSGSGGGGSGGSWSPGSNGSSYSTPGVAWGSAGGGGGGLVVSGGSPITGSGFDSSEAPVVAGSVTGYRWWTIPAPDLDGSPAHADADWPQAPLHGAWADWQPGVNHAACLASSGGCPGNHALVPERACHCGYWAYWGVQRHELGGTGTLPVFGVIKGFGKTLTGPHGFRCAKARILGVHLPLTIVNQEHLLAGSTADALRRHLPGHARVIDWAAQVKPPEPPTDEEIAAEQAKAEAWIAVIGDRIGQLYPGVRVFETRDALLRTFPPDTVYGRGQQH